MGKGKNDGGNKGGQAKGGGGQPSVVSNKPSVVSNKPSVVSNKPSVVSNKPSVVSNKPSVVSKPNKTPTPPSTPAPKKTEKEKVQDLKATARASIAGATSAGIADPAAYKKALNKLQSLGKDTAVRNIRSERRAAQTRITANQSTNAGGGENNNQGGNNNNNNNQTVNPSTGLTIDDLNQKFGEFAESFGTTIGTTFQGFLDQYKPQTQQEERPTQQEEGPGFEETYRQDLQDFLGNLSSQQSNWLQDYSAEQERRQSQYSTDQQRAKEDYQSMLSEIGTKEGAFDPELFRGLLGELESSKYRQKLWNETSAKAAYKY